MYRTPQERHKAALDLLPPMPCEVEVVAPRGGTFPLMLASEEGGLIYAYGSRDHVSDGAVLVAKLRNDEGDGHDIRFSVIRSYFQSGDDLLLHLKVAGIEDHFATRSAPRAELVAEAVARVIYAQSVPKDERLAVRLSDVSQTGLSFVTSLSFEAGDLLEITAQLPDRSVRLEARVIRAIPALYGRSRVGCEFTNILDADRHTIGMLATLTQQQGSEDDRDPNMLETLEQARAQQRQREQQQQQRRGFGR
jgi:hypothetical protein